MKVARLTPILNVSDIRSSFEWFEKLGWRKGWDWGNPPTFGGAASSKASKSPGRRRTCRGARASCTCVIPTGTCSA